jgi:O-antigen/teichoic acid export membrane protein
VSVRSAVGWSFATQYAVFGLQFATAIILTRLLSPAEMGAFGVAFAAAMILQVFQEFNLGRYLVQEKTLTPEKTATVVGVFLVLGLALATALWLAATPMARFYGADEIGQILRIVAVSFLISAISFAPAAMLLREMRLGALAVVRIGSVLVGSAAGILTAWHGAGALSQAWLTLATAVATTLLAFALRPDMLRVLPSLKAWRSVASFGGKVTAVTMVMALTARWPELVLGRLAGLAPVGIYGRAASLSDQARQLLYSGGVNGLYPAFARMHNERADMAAPYVRYLGYFTVVAFPALFLLALLAEPIILLLFGPRWSAAALPLTYLAIGQLLLSGVILSFDLMVIFERFRQLLKIEIGLGVASLALLAWGAWSSGVEGAALSRIPYGLLYAMAYTIALKPLLGFSWGALARALIQSSAVALIASAPALWLVLRSGDMATLPVWALFATLAACAVAWVAALFALRHPLRLQLRFR